MSPPAGALLSIWRHTSSGAGGSWVVPDGCLDLIGRQTPGQAPQWTVSNLMDRSIWIDAPEGQRYVGLRMRAGAQVDRARLVASVRGRELDDTPSLLAQIEAAVRLDARVIEALQALSAERSVQAATAQLGVSERTLQRLLSPATGRSPVYWKRLARLRQTALALRQANALADLAHDHGFTDQAHMSRELRAWLGVSPRQLQQQDSLLRLLGEPGFGNEGDAPALENQ